MTLFEKCPQCRRLISTYKPRHGDGTVRFFRPHVCYSRRSLEQHGGTLHWDCVRRRAEVPGWQMNSVQRDVGIERPR